jgi:hypothetical protein
MESLGLVFRALVMLACLAVVPLVALYGKYAPDFAHAVMEAFKARTQAAAASDPKAAGGEAPPFAGSTSRASGGRPATLPGSPRTGAPAPWADRAQSARPLSDLERQPAGTGSQNATLERASFNAPLNGRDGEDAGDPGRSADPPPLHGSPKGSAAPMPLPARSIALASGVTAESHAGDASAADNCTAQFRRMEQRLRELGATYYLLETWGSSGDRYRFFCKMALAGNADYNRNRIFQATAADPLRAMQDVLGQVEQWRAGSTP